ncbi:MAG TPA: response regulator [Ktedonobacteraceae bacterium]|nr:response regulator [Ktedonobacteraceae bacterium]
MADRFRILVVEDEETLNQSIVNSLRKDGYLVQGVNSGAEAIRILWSEECDVVISDQKTPGADGFELLQWLRTYRPETRMIMLSAYGSPATRTQALEGGAVSYLEKPLNLHQLKEELRRLLQQTGFSASLDSFDLLDVIQIINMSRKSIALLVNTGLEERGVLRFQEGELIWAEYGTLRGEEAFFALAAHKNGTVVHQPWNAQITPNVTQPLSRLIFQALQYRSKYAVRQQLSGEQEAIPHQGPAPIQTPAQMPEEIDDTPFVFAVDPSPLQQQEQGQIAASLVINQEQRQAEAGLIVNQEQKQPSASMGINQEQWMQEAEHIKEWWQDTGHSAKAAAPADGRSAGASGANGNGRHSFASPASKPGVQDDANITPSTLHKTPAGQRPDLPAWLTEQPTRSDLQPLRPSALSSSGPMPVPLVIKTSPAEWQPPSLSTVPRPTITPTPIPPAARTTEQQRPVERRPRPNPSKWQPPERPEQQSSGQQPARSSSGPLQGMVPPTPATKPTPIPPSRVTGNPPAVGGRQSDSLRIMANVPVVTNPNVGAVTGTGVGDSAPHHMAQPERQHTLSPRRNYQALVSALQTLGYSIPGFVAAAVVGLDGQPVAQVAVDDLDISQMCRSFSALLQSGLRSLEQGGWGSHEETVITSADRHILLRLVGDATSAFQVLITTREAEPAESLEVMANVEGAISAALR